MKRNMEEEILFQLCESGTCKVLITKDDEDTTAILSVIDSDEIIIIQQIGNSIKVTCLYENEINAIKQII